MNEVEIVGYSLFIIVILFIDIDSCFSNFSFLFCFEENEWIFQVQVQQKYNKKVFCFIFFMFDWSINN